MYIAYRGPINFCWPKNSLLSGKPNVNHLVQNIPLLNSKQLNPVRVLSLQFSILKTMAPPLQVILPSTLKSSRRSHN